MALEQSFLVRKGKWREVSGVEGLVTCDPENQFVVSYYFIFLCWGVWDRERAVVHLNFSTFVRPFAN